MQSDSRPIVVVGSINIDLVSRVPRIPRAGETIFGYGFQTHPGGKGANQAVGIARLGGVVKMIGMVGRDAFGKEMREHLSKEGVDMTSVGDVDDATGIASIFVDDAGENSIVVTAGANLHVTPDLLRSKSEILRTAGAVLTQLEIPVETVLCLSEMCAEMNVPLILDPAPAQTLPAETLHGVTWMTPNETEAQFYAKGATTEEELVNMLFKAGAHGVILKRGALGSVLAGEDRITHRIAAHAVRAIDTTAAGDAFNAAFAVGLMKGYEPVKSAEFASVSAAISVTRAGAQPSLATWDEVMASWSDLTKRRSSRHNEEPTGGNNAKVIVRN
ncbi:ribokinase [Granulicella mallensis]|uniref:Ribokinase n=1 Tax=Granulicella mallensis TaxID=940614 RepID=A0A7W7ZUM0_9BACT|nr:ribokinase [Granulicella mallensis]MBB5066057.1 ribokinase [Granulicella mallensis]